jgi:hypothetical protein
MSYKSIVLAMMFLGLGCTNPAPSKGKKEPVKALAMDDPTKIKVRPNGIADSQPMATPNPQPEAVPTPTPDARPEPQPEAKPAATASPVSSTVKVKLLDAGASPQKVLRLKPTKGDKISTEMSMDMGMEVSINGTVLPSPKTPTIRMLMDIEFAEITAAKDIRYNFVFNKVTLDPSPDTPPQMRAAIETGLRSMEGLSGFSLVDDRGFTKEAEFKVPDNAAANIKQTLDGMKQSLNQLSAPLPEEAVGVGAKWQVEQTVTSNGISLQQTALYELLSLKGDVITLGVVLKQTAAEQNVAAPGLPRGTKITLTALDSTGSGEIQLSLEKVMPSLGNMESKSKFDMSTNEGGKTQAMSMQMNMKMGLQSK